jgi:RimJ/RimL family protein N-acetyltransferase
MLQGKIVILRPMERADIPRLWEFAQDMDLALVTGADGRPTSLAAIERMYEEQWSDVSGDAVRWAISAHDLLIGGVELRHIDWRNRSAELAVWIGDRTYRQRGCGADATRLATDYAFKLLGLNRLYFMAAESNQAALRNYLKVGFREEGRMRQAQYRDGRYHDLVVLGMLRDEWMDDTERLEAHLAAGKSQP